MIKAGVIEEARRGGPAITDGSPLSAATAGPYAISFPKRMPPPPPKKKKAAAWPTLARSPSRPSRPKATTRPDANLKAYRPHAAG